jgi:hypothetical protein
MLQTAPIQNYNFTVTSNTDKLNVAAVAGVFLQDGVVVNTDYERYSLRLNLDYDISKKFKVGFNLAPSLVKDNTPRTDGSRGTGILFNALHTWPVMDIYDENGELTFFNQLPAETGNIFKYPNWVRSAQNLLTKPQIPTYLQHPLLSINPLKDYQLSLH